MMYLTNCFLLLTIGSLNLSVFYDVSTYSLQLSSAFAFAYVMYWLEKRPRARAGGGGELCDALAVVGSLALVGFVGGSFAVVGTLRVVSLVSGTLDPASLVC